MIDGLEIIEPDAGSFEPLTPTSFKKIMNDYKDEMCRPRTKEEMQESIAREQFAFQLMKKITGVK